MASIFVEHERSIGEFELHDRVFLEHGADGVLVGMDDVGNGIGFRIIRVVDGLSGEIAFVEVPDRLVAMRAVSFHQARFVFAHASGDFLDGFVQSDIHIFAFGVGFDGDMVSTKENDFGDVSVFLHIQDSFGLDDTRVVEVEALDFAMGVVTEGISHLLVAYRDSDGQIDVGGLHDFVG